MRDKSVSVILSKLNNLSNITNINDIFVNKSDLPAYEIILKEKFDASSLNPYILKVEFDFNDKVFKKRLLNILKSNKHSILYDFSTVNKGGLFKNNYELELFLKLERNHVDLNLVDYILLDIFTLGFYSLMTMDEKIRVRLNLNRLVFEFNSKEKLELFRKEINVVLHGFLEGHYNYYLNLCSENNL